MYAWDDVRISSCVSRGWECRKMCGGVWCELPACTECSGINGTDGGTGGVSDIGESRMFLGTVLGTVCLDGDDESMLTWRENSCPEIMGGIWDRLVNVLKVFVFGSTDMMQTKR